jgi:hypothetical protein
MISILYRVLCLTAHRPTPQVSKSLQLSLHLSTMNRKEVYFTFHVTEDSVRKFLPLVFTLCDAYPVDIHAKVI